jgi:tellurite resistance-related uncharacterized protein
MKTLPSQLTPYKRTPEFTDQSVPKALLGSHSTKPGTWAMIVVLEGSLTFRILEPVIESIAVDSEHPGIIEPTVSHKIEPHAGVRFHVQFYK